MNRRWGSERGRPPGACPLLTFRTMKFFAVAGLLAVGSRLAFGGYLVQLDGGDRMTVDSYWTDGDRLHLMQKGVELSIQRARVRSIRPVSGDAPRPSHADPAPVSGGPSRSREELEVQGRAIDHHLLHVQQERAEAAERGEPAAKLGRLEKEFRRTQQRRVELLRELQRLDAGN